MNRKENDIIINTKEGNLLEMLSSLEKAFDGKQIGNTYIINDGITDSKISFYSVWPNFEVLVVQMESKKNIIINRSTDDNPDYFHINIMKDGKVTQDYNGELQQMEAGTPKGIFIYNGLFPLKSDFPAGYALRSISLKLSKEALMHQIPEAIEIIETLFKDEEPKGYHLSLSMEMERILDDILHYENSDFGRNLLVNAKSMELFTLLMQSIKKRLNNDELNGLHIADYNRLLKIKDYIIKNLDNKISIEDLADEFAISVSKLQRDFKTLFNSSVYQFYTQAKMDEAYRRLKTGKFSVMQVGYDMGYNSMSKFSRMFKKIKGVSPKEVIPK